MAFAIGSTASMTASGVHQTATILEGTDLHATVRKRLMNSVAEAVAAMDAEGGAEVDEQDVREAINSMSREDLDDLASQLVDRDTEGAAALIAGHTEFTQRQAEDLINGVYNALEERFGDPDDDESLAEDLRQQLRKQVAGVIAMGRAGRR